AGLTNGEAFPLGVTTNVFQVSDAAGNTATCSFTVTVNDNQPPTISCPINIVTTNDVGQCSAVVSYTPPVGSDNCPGAVTTQIAGLTNGAAFPVGVTTNVFQVTDAAGNSATCSYTVTTNDVGQCSAVVSYTPPVGSDNCPGALTTQITGLTNGAVFPVGVTTNVFQVTDAAGNSATCSFTVTVNDAQPPAITCPPNL